VSPEYVFDLKCLQHPQPIPSILQKTRLFDLLDDDFGHAFPRYRILLSGPLFSSAFAKTPLPEEYHITIVADFGIEKTKESRDNPHAL
jgi:hypothetical protein